MECMEWNRTTMAKAPPFTAKLCFTRRKSTESTIRIGLSDMVFVWIENVITKQHPLVNDFVTNFS